MKIIKFCLSMQKAPISPLEVFCTSCFPKPILMKCIWTGVRRRAFFQDNNEGYTNDLAIVRCVLE